MSQDKAIVRPMTMLTDTGVAGKVDTTGDIAVIDVTDLASLSLVVNQLVDAGTATLAVAKTFDGVNWIPVGSALTDASFAAGNNVGVELTLSDTNGMGLHCMQVRLSATAIAGGGVYSFVACGLQRKGYA